MFRGRIGDCRYRLEFGVKILCSFCTPSNRAHCPPEPGERDCQSVTRISLQCRYSRPPLAAGKLCNCGLYRVGNRLRGA